MPSIKEDYQALVVQEDSLVNRRDTCNEIIETILHTV
jgi:hypothetical protein